MGAFYYLIFLMGSLSDCVSAISRKSGLLSGEVIASGDKSISHRALIISAIATGSTVIEGLLEGEDVMRTADALRLAGVRIEKIGGKANKKSEGKAHEEVSESIEQSISQNISEKGDGKYIVYGVGIGGLSEPENVMYLGNSGTSARLLFGLFAPYGFNSFFTGDESLSRRPMGRVIEPLSEMGVEFLFRENGKLPICVKGSCDLVPIRYEMKVPSAQVKSAIMLAAVQSCGDTVICEKERSRDHSEFMLKAFGADIKVDGLNIIISGGKQLVSPELIVVPKDPSSIAFFIAAALIVPDSKILIKSVCVNPTRVGFIEVVQRMGGKVDLVNVSTKEGGVEPVADISVEYSGVLNAINLEAEIAPRMIDEYPILAVLTSFANGTTVMNGLRELVVKESNRLEAVYNSLKLCGVDCSVDNEKYVLSVIGSNGSAVRGTVDGESVSTRLDHRIAMSFLIMGLGSNEGVRVDDINAIRTSFPNFIDILRSLGGDIMVDNVN